MTSPELYLGLDNTRPAAIRAVWLVAESRWCISPLLWGKFCSLQELTDAFTTIPPPNYPTTVAIATRKRDLFGGVEWLTDLGLQVTRYSRRQTWIGGFDEEAENWGLPRAYRRAYGLALRAAYEREAPVLLDELRTELEFCRASIEDLEEVFERLQAVCPCPF